MTTNTPKINKKKDKEKSFYLFNVLFCIELLAIAICIGIIIYLFLSFYSINK